MVKQPSFDLTSQDFKRDPTPCFEQMRAAGPMVQVQLPLIGTVWTATTYEAVGRLLRDQEHFALEPRHAGRRGLPGVLRWLPRSLRVLAKNMLTTDEPDHRRLRRLVEQAFLRRSVGEMRDRLTSLARRGLDELAAAARANPESVDFVRHFARQYPLAVICELLGLPEEDRPRFTRFADRLTKASTLPGLLSAVPGVWRLLRYLREQLRECRRRPRPGLISALVEAEHEGERLSEDELLSMSFLLLFAGHETTVHLITMGVITLLEHPDQRRRLEADWSLAPTAADEALRYTSPIQFTKPRYAKRDLEFFGRRIQRGAPCLALLASANHDPQAFENPEEFDVARRPNRHVGFGAGIHTCLGMQLARAETATAFELFFRQFPQVELATHVSELTWIGRPGIRSVAAAPLRLGERGESTAPPDTPASSLST